MGQLVEEVKLWNTPIVGAYLLWKFTQGYSKGHPNADAPIGLLHFVATAILTSNKLIKPISKQRDGLQSYVRSFEDSKKSDLLLNIQQRTLDKRKFTIESIDIAVAEGLLVWDFESGKLYSRDITKRPKRGNALNNIFKQEGLKAEILGEWFSQHELASISSYLNLIF